MGEGTLVELVETGYILDDVNDLVGCAVGWGEAMTLLKFYLEKNITYGIVPEDKMAS